MGVSNPSAETGPSATRYQELSTARTEFLRRAELCSKLTLPTLLPPEGSTKSSELYKPHQSLGARGVNNVSGKLLLTILPPNAPFFRLIPDPKILRKLEEAPQLQAGKSNKTVLEETLSEIEQTINKEIETQRIRPAYSEGLRHLVACGNVLLHKYSVKKRGKTKRGLKVFPLNQYVVRRDPEGNPLEIIVKEVVDREMISDPAIQAKVSTSPTTDPNTHKAIDLYTHVYLHDGRWYVHQEAFGMTVAGSEGNYPEDLCPWFPLRWTAIDGEAYGRSLVEEYIGDIVSLETLAKALLEGASNAAKILWMVKPSAITNPQDLEKESGSVIVGDLEDVGALQMQKYADFAFVKATFDGIEQRLSSVFLVAQPRSAERVTAEEIRLMINELETALGGSYTVQAQEFQLPLVNHLIKEMEADGRMQKMPEMAVTPTVITGIDALGRNQELMRLRTAIQGLAQDLGPQVLAEYINPAEYIGAVFAAVGVSSKRLVRSEEEVTASRQAMQQQSLAEKAIAPGINAVNQQFIASQESNEPSA
jgi:hypothetical protein